MTSRIYGWTQESVHCLNIIDIVFADDKIVRDAWKDLYDKYCVQTRTQHNLKNPKCTVQIAGNYIKISWI